MKGWVQIHRSLMKNKIWDNPDCLKFWIWCLLKASHKRRETIVGLQNVTIEAGDFIFGRYVSGKELKMSPSKTYRQLLFLKDVGYLNIKTTNKFTVVSVINWKKYQVVNNKRTTNEQQMDTNNNNNISLNTKIPSTLRTVRRESVEREGRKKKIQWASELSHNDLYEIAKRNQVSFMDVKDKATQMDIWMRANRKYQNIAAQLETWVSKDVSKGMLDRLDGVGMQILEQNHSPKGWAQTLKIQQQEEIENGKHLSQVS